MRTWKCSTFIASLATAFVVAAAAPASAAQHNPIPPGPFVTKVPSVNISSTSAPGYDRWLTESVIPTIQAWYAPVGDALSIPRPRRGHPGYSPSTIVTVQVDLNATFYGGVSGSTIIFGPEWARSGTNRMDLGGVVHELTHVIEAYPLGVPGWIVEGMAEWARDYIYGDRVATFPLPGQSYLDGSETSAYFLQWIQDTYDPWFIHDLNVQSHNGQYSDAFFVERTGLTADELYAQMTAP